MSIIILLLLFVIYIIHKRSKKEEFYGMNYIQHHAYLKCCNVLGCQHPRCKNFLLYNASPLNLIGVLYNKNSSKEDLYKLYSRRNNNTNRDEYFIKIYNSNDDYILKKLKVKYLYNGDEVTINNDKYVVSFYENNGLPIYNNAIPLYNNNHYYNREFPIYNNYYNRFTTNNLYSGSRINRFYRDSVPYNYIKQGYIHDSSNNDYMLIYKNQTGRNRWKYYVKKSDILLPLDKYENKDLYTNDKIKVPFNNKTYDFKELDN